MIFTMIFKGIMSNQSQNAPFILIRDNLYI